MATVGLVERWRDDGTPTAAARLAEVEALASLGLLDRAWARLEALAEADAPRVARLRLHARLLALREGGARARAAVEALRQAAPKDAGLPDLEALLDRPAAAAPDLPPSDAPLEVQLRAAAELLAAGAHVRARRFVQTLAERFGPVPPVVEMVRAVHGDFGLDDRETRRLLEQHGTAPTISVPAVDDIDLPGAESTQLTRFSDPESGADADVDADEPGESTQVLRVLGGETGEAWKAPAVATPDLEEEDDGVVLVARRPSPPPVTRRPLPAPRAPTDADLPLLDMDTLEDLDDGPTESLPAGALAAAMPGPETPAPEPEAPPPAPAAAVPTAPKRRRWVRALLATAAAVAGLAAGGLAAAWWWLAL